MSKLLIHKTGHHSSSLVGAGGGGLVLAPDARLLTMKFDALGGVEKPAGVGHATGTTTLHVNAVRSLLTGNILYFTNSGAQSDALTQKLLIANGLDLTTANTQDRGYCISPWFSNGTISAPKLVNENMFVVGQSPAFYCKAVVRISDITNTRDMTIGFAKCETDVATPVDVSEIYGGGFKDTTLDDGSLIEHLATAGTDAHADTGLDAANDTDITIEVQVSAAGVCTLIVNGNTVTQTGKTFADGLEVRPVIHYLSGAGGAVTALRSFEWGPQSARR